MIRRFTKDLQYVNVEEDQCKDVMNSSFQEHLYMMKAQKKFYDGIPQNKESEEQILKDINN